MIISPSPRFQKQIFHDISSVSLTIKTHTHTHTKTYQDRQDANEMVCWKTKNSQRLLCAVGFALYDPLPWLSEKHSPRKSRLSADGHHDSLQRSRSWQPHAAPSVALAVLHIPWTKSTCQGSSSSRDVANNANDATVLQDILQDLGSLSRSLKILGSHVAKSCRQLPNETPALPVRLLPCPCCCPCATRWVVPRGSLSAQRTLQRSF